MTVEVTVYTDELGKDLWLNGELLEARRQPDQEEGFVIPITITKESIIFEINADIIDVQKSTTV